MSNLNKLFANFLWKKNYIYGYTHKKYPKQITYLYLKYNTYIIPENIDLETASILESLAVVLHGYERSEITKDKKGKSKR